jgi:hypothetical protein
VAPEAAGSSPVTHPPGKYYGEPVCRISRSAFSFCLPSWSDLFPAIIRLDRLHLTALLAFNADRTRSRLEDFIEFWKDRNHPGPARSGRHKITRFKFLVFAVVLHFLGARTLASRVQSEFSSLQFRQILRQSSKILSDKDARLNRSLGITKIFPALSIGGKEAKKWRRF